MSEQAFNPFKLYLESRGYDLGSTEDYIMEPNDMKKIRTDLAFEFPQGFYGRLTSRSGLVYEHSIDILAGKQFMRQKVLIIFYTQII